MLNGLLDSFERMAPLLSLLSLLYVRGETAEKSWRGSKCVDVNRKLASTYYSSLQKIHVGFIRACGGSSVS